MESDLSQRDCLEVRYVSSASQLSRTTASLLVAFEQFEKHCGRPAASQLRFE